MLQRMDGPESAPTESTDRAEVLDVVIAHRRNELDVRQARFERAETQAAGLIVAAVTLAGLTATVLINVKNTPSARVIVLIALGVVFLALAFLSAFAARDTQTRMSRWFRRLPFKGVQDSTTRLLAYRKQYNDMEKDPEDALEDLDSVRVRQEIASWQRDRLELVRNMVIERERAVRLAALLFVAGGGWLLLSVVLAAAWP